MKRKGLVLLCAVVLAGCSGKAETSTTHAPVMAEVSNTASSKAGSATPEPTKTSEVPVIQTEAPEAKKYSLEYNEKKISVDDDVAAVISSLGDARKEETVTSKAFVGEEKIYTYDALTLVTYPGDTKDYIESISLRKDSIATAEGIKIGSSKSELEGTYGDKLEKGKNGIYTCKIDNTELRFIVLNDKVAAIDLFSDVKNKKLTSDKSKPEVVNAFEVTLYTDQKEEEVDYYRYVAASDERDVHPRVVADYSAVDMSKTGSYKVVYYAYDRAGNRSSKMTTTYTVAEKEANYTEPDKVDKLADQVVKKIIKEDMSTQQKCTAIYKWIRSNFSYSNTSDKIDWVQAANNGLRRKTGDCFTYYSVAQELLYRSGVQSMRVQKNPGYESTHYWNLVYVPDQGWYHFDTTPRVGGGDNFDLVTDSWLLNYSRNHSNSHDFDTSKYPATPTKSVQK
ncbi:MAG: transglutaminase-like domain-containing protein [bacterium]|nr:transglutaminase-like domain-containing protein [bacterium]